MARVHILPHKVSAFIYIIICIYIYIYIDRLIDELCLLFGALRIIGATTNQSWRLEEARVKKGLMELIARRSLKGLCTLILLDLECFVRITHCNYLL